MAIGGASLPAGGDDWVVQDSVVDGDTDDGDEEAPADGDGDGNGVERDGTVEKQRPGMRLASVGSSSTDSPPSTRHYLHNQNSVLLLVAQRK